MNVGKEKSHVVIKSRYFTPVSGFSFTAPVFSCEEIPSPRHLVHGVTVLAHGRCLPDDFAHPFGESANSGQHHHLNNCSIIPVVTELC